MAKNSKKIQVKLIEYYAESYQKRVCCFCDNPLEDGTIGQPRVACSSECFSAARSLAEKTLRRMVCIICKEPIPGDRNSRSACCSDACVKEKDWRRNLFRVHHIRVERVNEILESQSGCCAVCGRDFYGDKSLMNVDHDHACCPGRIGCGGCVRGILCNGCNGGMGLFKDNPNNLIAAASYLFRYKEGK